MHTAVARLQRTEENLVGGNVRGWLLRAHLLWVREYGSADEERIVAAGLPEGFDPDDWYPFGSLIALDREVVRQFSASADEWAILEDLGRFSARVNLSIRFAHSSEDDHHRFFDETTRFHHQLQDFGRAVYRRIGPARGLMVLSDYPCFSAVYCASAAGWYEQCLLLHGAIRPSVTEEECRCNGDPACLFSLRWR